MKILIIGGGTAGWMAAAYLSKDFSVTLVESPNIPIVGVGESTLPIMRKFCSDLGLAESDWMHKCQAEFKLGARHMGWRKNKPEHWWHWFLYDRSLDDTMQHFVNHNELPSTEYSYAYHVDATKFGTEVMRPVAEKNGITYISSDVVDVLLDNDGYIDSVILANNMKMKADLFIDATGFAKVLAKKVGIHYKRYEHLINDSAIACPQELAKKQNRYTITRTMNHGWMWEIALKERRGAGYVFSSQHCSKEEAIREYLQYFPDSDLEKIKLLKFTPEYAATPFYKNVVTIGMSSGFIEPLESNSIWLIIYNIFGLYRSLTENKSFDVFNRAFNTVSQEIYNFTLSHYTLSNHDHTEYWRYYKDVEDKLKLRQRVSELAQQPDKEFGKYTGIFPPYSWWTKDNYFK